MREVSMTDYNLQRFLDAQRGDYEQALAEVRNGRKYSHWIWYIFPQLKGLGMSYNHILPIQFWEKDFVK